MIMVGAALLGAQKNYDDTEDDRTRRLGTAESGLPVPLWGTIAALPGPCVRAISSQRLVVAALRVEPEKELRVMADACVVGAVGLEPTTR